MQRVHIIGIGGIGTSALARYFKAEKMLVSGSDAAASAITDALKKEKIKISIGHKRSNITQSINRVVYSAAVKKNNPELIQAQQLGIPAHSYAEALGELTTLYDTIAVAGSHGKSTTSSLIALILIKAGFDPTVIVGTNLKELGGKNFRKGKSIHLVIEADEWNKSFYHHYPKIAVITNIDKEHLDVYKNYRGVLKGFSRFIKNVRNDGVIVANGGDKGIKKIVKEAKAKVIFYNAKKGKEHPLKIPGAHNQENAEAAWQVARLLNIQKEVVERVFRSHTGTWRRFEKLVPKRKSIRAALYTDYAHHPTEIKATIAAARAKYPKKKIVCVFQPHHQDRLEKLFKEFKGAFHGADKTIILPVYHVTGREKKKRGKTSESLVKAMKKKTVFFAKGVIPALKTIKIDFEDKNSVILFMSAGDLDARVREFLTS